MTNLRYLRKASRREIKYDFENERKEFEKKVSIVRIGHKEQYWNMQTQVENHWIATHKMERIEKMQNDITKWRTQICNMSWAGEKQMKYLAEREKKLLHRMQMKDVQENKRKLLNRYKLDAMQIESKRWPKLNNIDEFST